MEAQRTRSVHGGTARVVCTGTQHARCAQRYSPYTACTGTQHTCSVHRGRECTGTQHTHGMHGDTGCPEAQHALGFSTHVVCIGTQRSQCAQRHSTHTACTGVQRRRVQYTEDVQRCSVHGTQYTQPAWGQHALRCIAPRSTARTGTQQGHSACSVHRDATHTEPQHAQGCRAPW